MNPYLPGASFTRTLTLPMRSHSDSRAWIVSSAVSGAYTSSTSLMIDAGLNQCMPMNRARRASATAWLSSAITRPEVLVANSASACTIPSISAQTFFFRSMSSGTASMIRSTSLRSSSLVVNDRLARALSICSWVVLPRSTPRLRP